MIIKPIENNKRDMVDEEDVDDEVDWSALPYHMVELMMDKLMTADDYIRCGAVCTSWRTIFIDRHHHHRVHVTLPPPPVLVVPTPKELNKRKVKKKKKNNNKKKKKTKSFGFYSIISKKVINQFQVTIPNNRYFRGSSYGWLVAVDNDSEIRLFNPFLLSPSAACCNPTSSSSSSSRSNNNYNEILLPSLKHLPCDPYLSPYPYGPDENPPYCTHLDLPSSYSYLRKAILSVDPLSNPIDYIVMAIFGPVRELAFCRPGHHDKTWTRVDDDDSMYHDYDFQNYDFQDVIYYKGFFFALQTHGPLVVLDPARNMMAVTLQIPPIDSRLMINGPTYDTPYLVELEGVLLQVLRLVEAEDNDTVMKRQPYSTTSFQVFELQGINDKNNNFDIANVNDHQDGKELNWKLMKNLRGHTLFLGDNDSICVRASDYPGCRPNSIYFTDDYLEMYHCRPWNGPHDLGVFNLENNTIENHYPTNHNTPIWPVPIWIQPSIACRRKKKEV